VANEKPNIKSAISIYKVTSPTGKVYIGQTVDLAKRWSQYRNGHSKRQAKLHASFQKHGIDAHGFTELCSLPDGTHQIVIDRHEQLFMDLYREAGYELLNLRHAGCTGKHSKTSREKMKGRLGKWMIGRKLDPGTIAKRTAKQKGMKRSNETRQRLAASKRGAKNPRYGQRPWNYGLRGLTTTEWSKRLKEREQGK